MKYLKSNVVKSVCVIVGILWGMNVHAYEWWFDGYVRTVEPTYAPTLVHFTMDRGAGSCPGGKWLRFNPRGSTEAQKTASYDTMYKTLIAARLTNRVVRIYGSNASCTVNHVHFK